jgi:sortase A
VDLKLWSDSRIKDYLESLESPTDAPQAVLRVPKLHLEVPVYEGSDELTLNRGLGRIIGTARLGEPGNTGIAGHRDGFFRGLKDIGPGDTLELLLPHRTDRYVVTNILITNPDDVSVLQPSSVASLTLVTCYPFYFVGSAPRRYIVQASSDDSARLNMKE